MVPKVGRPRFWRCGIGVDGYLLQIQFQLTIMCAYVVYLFTCLLNFFGILLSHYQKCVKLNHL